MFWPWLKFGWLWLWWCALRCVALVALVGIALVRWLYGFVVLVCAARWLWFDMWFGGSVALSALIMLRWNDAFVGKLCLGRMLLPKT
jgi:hypothetical protein